MGILDTLQEGVTNVGEFVQEHPIGTAVGVGAVAVGSGLAIASVIRKKTSKRTSRGHRKDRRFKSKQKYEQRYKRKRKYKVYGKKGWIHPKKSKSRHGKKVSFVTKSGKKVSFYAK